MAEDCVIRAAAPRKGGRISENFVIGVGGLGFVLAFVTRAVVTAILLKIIDGMSKSLSIRSFGTAFLGALIMSFVGTLGEALLRH